MKTFMVFIMFVGLLWNTSVNAQDKNPRLKHFRHGTGQASWWEQKATPAPRPQVIYYPPAIRYYQPMPYYGHFAYCRCHICHQRRIMWQLQMNPQRFFFFQFGF